MNWRRGVIKYRGSRAALVVACAIATLTVGGSGAAFAEHAHHTLTVHATSSAVTAPATTRPGLTYVRDTGDRPLVIFARKRSGAKRLSRLLATWAQPALREQRTEYGYVTVLAAHSGAYVWLQPKTYYFAAAPQRAGGTAPVDTLCVAGSTVDSAPPRTPSVRFAPTSGLHATALTGRGGVTQPVRYIELDNPTAVERGVLFERLAPSTSQRALTAFLADPTPANLHRLHYRLVGDAFVGAHQDVFQTANGLRVLPRGRYLLLGELLRPDRDEVAPLKHEEAVIKLG